VELVEKELANENINISKNNNKSFDIKSKDEKKRKKYSNALNISENEENYDKNKIKKDEKQENNKNNQRRIKIVKIIKQKIESDEKRSRTPDVLNIKRYNKKRINKPKKINHIKNKNIIDNNINKKIALPSQQKKINNIINNNSITIISHFDIEENSINKATLENNNKIISGNMSKKDNIDKIDSSEKDILNYIEENYNINSKKIIQQKIEELNYEINKNKEERNNINKIKKQYEKLNSQLIADIEIVNRQKEEFENYKKKEMEKIKLQKEKY
jgi:hypothetical protein